ncbi:MAG: hypothetical protein KDB90_08275 [Planctomycetes bacterium]|nr:hypothetical protein [Planctomycetota bacterium]
MSEFKINRGQGKCSITGRAFTDGEKYIVALKPDGELEGAFTRVDICMEAWERQGEAGYIAWWPTEYSTKRKPALLDPDALWEVFHKARRKEDEAPAPEAPTEVAEFSREDLDRFAYVAALGLMRLKKIKLKETRRKGKREYLVFDTPGRASQRETYEVLNPELDEAGVENIQDRLADLA